LEHIPSSSQYHHWVLTRRARARSVGASTRPFVHYKSVLRLLAPDRTGGNGWRLACRRVFGDQSIPPAEPTWRTQTRCRGSTLRVRSSR
jgi:hypothetical protein